MRYNAMVCKIKSSVIIAYTSKFSLIRKMIIPDCKDTKHYSKKQTGKRRQKRGGQDKRTVLFIQRTV